MINITEHIVIRHLFMELPGLVDTASGMLKLVATMDCFCHRCTGPKKTFKCGHLGKVATELAH